MESLKPHCWLLAIQKSLFVEIFTHLDYYDMVELMVCCKRIQSFIRYWESLQHSVDLRYKRILSEPLVSLHIAKFKNIKALSLDLLSFGPTPPSFNFLEGLPLQSLSLQGLVNFNWIHLRDLSNAVTKARPVSLRALSL